MDGAMDRIRHEKAMIWWGAMMPHMKKPPGFYEFTGTEKPVRKAVDWRAELAAWESYASRRH